jgi:hypothetical protein
LERFIECEKWQNKQAIEVAEKVFEMRRRILGEKHPDTLMIVKWIVALQERLDNDENNG